MATLASGWLRNILLLLWNCWKEFIETWQEARSQHPLPSLCFSCQSEPSLLMAFLWTEIDKTLQVARSQCPLPSLCFLSRSETKMAVLAYDWLRHFWLLLWNRRREFNKTEVRVQRSLPSLCFAGWSENQDGCPGLWLAETFYFYFFSETAEWNFIKLDRKQELNVLYQVNVFRWKTKMAALTSDWLRNFLLLWNRRTEFNETWQEARSQHPLPSLCFSGQPRWPPWPICY